GRSPARQGDGHVERNPHVLQRAAVPSLRRAVGPLEAPDGQGVVRGAALVLGAEPADLVPQRSGARSVDIVILLASRDRRAQRREYRWSHGGAYANVMSCSITRFVGNPWISSRARALRVSVPLSLPALNAASTLFSISRCAVTPKCLRNLRTDRLNACSFMGS